MNQFLIEYLLNENPRYSGIHIPESEQEQFRLYRSLVNIRSAASVNRIKSNNMEKWHSAFMQSAKPYSAFILYLYLRSITLGSRYDG